MASWSRSLRTTLGILLHSRHPMFLWWGPELVQFYNDGYRPSLGADRHPAALGASGRAFWADIWPTIGPEIDAVMQHGHSTWHDDQLVPIFRNGRVEEVYWTYGYSPVRDDDGTIGGTLVVVQEQTTRVIGDRRLRTLRDLAELSSCCETESQLRTAAIAALAANPHDLPWASILVGNDQGPAVLAPFVDRVYAGGESVIVIDASTWEPSTPVPWPASVDTVCLVPIRLAGGTRPDAVLAVAASPRLPWNSAYQDFITLAANQVALSLVSARKHDEERRRLDALARLDRAKTDFFSGISHELRTPLTLMLGPTEEALASPAQALAGDSLRLVHRNELRLLKLVTTLLEFSRIEADRAVARFAPLDLTSVTAEACGAFRSTIERAALTFDVECAPLPEPVYVDHDMWERVVLNLISNAYKFTLSGTIRVSLHSDGSSAVLQVSDTGAGIPVDELPHVFERFHRIRTKAARTQEGSGIGLALVRELVRMHGGQCAVTSEIGRGSTFTVTIPHGVTHLDPRQVDTSLDSRVHSHASTFVQEAIGWNEAHGPKAIASGAARVLVVDDDRDMRDYLRHLLEPRWLVDVAQNGEGALEVFREHPPDLVITDVMMPGLDGFGLLRAIRNEPGGASLPVLLLTARAGEEACIDGWAAGADDYLVKPFSPRELVARVEAQLQKRQARQVESEVHHQLQRLLANAPVGIAILRGPEHVYDFANPAYLGLVGGRSVHGRTLRDALPALTDGGVHDLLHRAYETGQPYVGRAVEVTVARLQGNASEQAFFDFVCQPLCDDTGSVEALCVVAFEVTELARARQDADESRRLMELAVDTGRMGSWRIDLRTYERWNSDRCLANFGRPPAATLSYYDVLKAQHPDDREQVRVAMASAIRDRTDYSTEYRVFWPDGSCHWLSVRGRTMYAPDGTPLYMVGNTLDVTEQRALLDELRCTRDDLEQRVLDRTADLARSHGELERLLAERTAFEQQRSAWIRTVMSAQEDERRRVARELHDEMGQHLLALNIGLHTLEPRPDDASLSRLRGIVARIDRAVHTLARDLRPAELDDLGLVVAVRSYVDEWSRRIGIRGDSSSRNCDSRLPAPIETALYRIVQEALTNIARHSRAQHASVIIECREQDVVVVIEDDGVGFAASGPRATEDSRFGLVGMRERAALLGGAVTIESESHGTSVFVTVPYQPEAVDV